MNLFETIRLRFRLPTLTFLRAQSYSAIKKPELAAKDLDAAGKLDPSDDKAFAKKAELTMNNGKPDQAIREYTKSVAANPKDWTRYKERADAYMQAGKKDEALADYSEVIKLTPKEPGAYMLRALALKSMKRYEEAIPDFSKTLELHADDDDAYMERSDCYRLMHRYKEALADLDKVSALLPANNNFVREARLKILNESDEKESLSPPQVPKVVKETQPIEARKDDYKAPLAAVIIAFVLFMFGFYLYKIKSK